MRRTESPQQLRAVQTAPFGNWKKLIDAVMAAHAEMLKLLSSQQMDIALQKFESEVAPRLQNIAIAAKRMIETQCQDLERMSAAPGKQKATTNMIMTSLVGAWSSCRRSGSDHSSERDCRAYAGLPAR